MKINEKEIRQAENVVETVGTISEYNISIRECIRKCDIDGEDTNVHSAWIGGTVIITSNGAEIKHSFTYLDTIRHTKKGDENSKFKGILTALGYDVAFNSDTKKLEYTKVDLPLIPKIPSKITWVDENKNEVNSVTIQPNGEPTRVKVTTKLATNIGLNKDKSNLSFYDDLPIQYISRIKVADEDSCRFVIEGVIKDIYLEPKGDGTTTDRYNVELVVPNFFNVDVFKLVMLNSWKNVLEDGETIQVTKDMFYDINNPDNSFCKIGDTVKLSGDIENHPVGIVKVNTTTRKSFGGGSQEIRSGYDRIERTIKAGDIVDGEDKYDIELIKKALEEREVFLDNEYNRLVEYQKSAPTQSKPNPSDTKPTSNPFGSSTSSANANPFGAKKKNPFG